MIGKAFITSSGNELARYLRYGQNRTLGADEKRRIYAGRVSWEKVEGTAIEPTAEQFIVETDKQRGGMHYKQRTKAYAHLIVAWPKDMSVSPETERETTLRYIDAMGLEGHGHYMVSHKDKPYQHTHTLVRRFAQGGTKMVPFYNVHYKLWEVSREIEEEQGRRRLPHKLTEYYEMEKGRDRPGFSIGSGGTIRSRLSSIEQLRGVTDRLLTAGSWEDIDRLIQNEGYVMEPRRSGLVAIKQESDIGVAFSTVTPKLSHTKLADRFGETWHDWAMRQHEQATHERARERALSMQGVPLKAAEVEQSKRESLTFEKKGSEGRPPVIERTPQTQTVETMATANSGMSMSRQQEILNWAANHYWMEARRLDEESVRKEDRTAATYMNQRGLRGETGDAYKIGYAKDHNTWLRKEAAKKGITDDELIEAGLAYRGSASGKAVSKYRGRVMFPVTDEGGNVTGFSGRNVPGVEETTPPRVNPKYLEMGKNNLFSKERALFGEQQAMTRGNKPLAVVEGYTDVTAMKGRNMYAVALGGAEPYEDQMDAIARIADKSDKKTVAVMLDGDKAGKNGNAKLVRGLTERGVPTVVVELKEGEDPYSLMESRSGGTETKAAIINRTVSGAEYLATRDTSGQRIEGDVGTGFNAEVEVRRQQRYIEGAIEASAMPVADERARMMRQIEGLYAQEFGERTDNGEDKARYKFNKFVQRRLEQVKAEAPDSQTAYYDRTIEEVNERGRAIAKGGNVPNYTLSDEDIAAGYGRDEGIEELEDELFRRPALSTQRIGERKAQDERAREFGALAGEGAAEKGPAASRDEALTYGDERTRENAVPSEEQVEQPPPTASVANVEGVREDLRKAVVDYKRTEAESDVLLNADQELRAASVDKRLSSTDREAARELRSSLKDDAQEAFTRMDRSGQALDSSIERARGAGLEVDERKLLESVPAAEAAREGAGEGVRDLLARRKKDIQSVESEGGDATGRLRAWEVASDAGLEVEERAIGELEKAEKRTPATEVAAAPKEEEVRPSKTAEEVHRGEEPASEAQVADKKTAETTPGSTEVTERKRDAVGDTSVESTSVEDSRNALRDLRAEAYKGRAEEAAITNAVARIDVEATDSTGGYILNEEQETVRNSLTEERKDVRTKVETTEGEVASMEETMRATYGPESVENIEFDRAKAYRVGVNRAVERIESAREFDTWEEQVALGPAVNVGRIDRIYDAVLNEAEKTRVEGVTSDQAAAERSTSAGEDAASGQQDPAPVGADRLREREEVRPLIQAEERFAEVQGRIALQERFMSNLSSERDELTAIVNGPRQELSDGFKEKLAETYEQWSNEGGWMANQPSEFEAYGDFDKVTRVKLDGARVAENQEWKGHPTYWVVEQDGERALVPSLSSAQGNKGSRANDDYFNQVKENLGPADRRAVEVEPIAYDLDARTEAGNRLQTVRSYEKTAKSRLRDLGRELRKAEQSVDGQRTRLEKEGLQLPEVVAEQRTLEETWYRGAEKEARGEGVQGRVSEIMKKEMRPALNNIYEEHSASQNPTEVQETAGEEQVTGAETTQEGTGAEQAIDNKQATLRALQEDLQEAQRAVVRNEGMAMATESVRATRTDAAIAFQANERGLQFGERDSFVEESQQAQRFLDNQMESYGKEMSESVKEFWKKAEAISSQYPDEDYREVLLDDGAQAKERAAGAAVAVESINRGMHDLRESSNAEKAIADGAYPQSSLREDERGLSVEVRETGIGTGQDETPADQRQAGSQQDTSAEAVPSKEKEGAQRFEPVVETIADPVKEPVMLTREGLIENDKRMITWDERQDAIAGSPYEPTSGAMPDVRAWEAQIERLAERLTPQDREYLAEMNVSNASQESDLVRQRMADGGPLPPSMEDSQVRAQATGTVVDPIVEREVLTTQNTIVERREGSGREITYEAFREEASSLIERGARGEITVREMSNAIEQRSNELSKEDQQWLSNRRAEVVVYESRPENGIQTKEGVARRFREDDMAPSDVDTLVSRISGEKEELSREGFRRVEDAMNSDEAKGIGRQTQVRLERQAIGRLSKEAEAQVIAERTPDDIVLDQDSLNRDVPERGPVMDDESAGRVTAARQVTRSVEDKIGAGEEISVEEYKAYRNSQRDLYSMQEVTADEGAAAVDRAKAQLSETNQQYVSLAQDLESRLNKGMIRSSTYDQEKAILGEPEPKGAGPGGADPSDNRGRREPEYVGVDYEGERIAVRARGLSDPEIEAQRELMYRYDANQSNPTYKEAVEIVGEMGGMGADQALNAVREERDVRKVMAEYASAGAPATLQSSTVGQQSYGNEPGQSAVADERVERAPEAQAGAAQETAQAQPSSFGPRAAVAAGAGGTAAAVATGGGSGTGEGTAGGNDNDGQPGDAAQPSDRRSVEAEETTPQMPERFVSLDEMSEMAKDMRAQVTYADKEVKRLRENAVVSKSEFEDVIRSTSESPGRGEIAVAQFRKDWEEKGYTRAVMDEVERSVDRISSIPVEERGSRVPDQETVQRSAIQVINSQKDAAVSTAYATDLRRFYANTVEAESTQIRNQERGEGGATIQPEGGARTEGQGSEGDPGQVRRLQEDGEGKGQPTGRAEGDERVGRRGANPDPATEQADGPPGGGQAGARRGAAERGDGEVTERAGRTSEGVVRDSSGDGEERGEAKERLSGGDDVGERRREGLSRSADGDGEARRGQKQGEADAPQQTGEPDSGGPGRGYREQQRSARAVEREYGGDPRKTGSRQGAESEAPLSARYDATADRRALGADRGSGTGLDPVAYRTAQPQARTPDEAVNLGRREFEGAVSERPEAVGRVKREMKEVREVGRVQQAYEIANEAEVRESGIKRLGQINTALGDDTEGNMQRARIQFRRTLEAKGVEKVDVNRIAERFEQWNQRLGYRASMYVLDQEMRKLDERPIGYTGIDANIPSQTEGMTRYSKDSIPYAATRLSAAASVAQYQEDTGRASERELLNQSATTARTTLSEVYRNPQEVLRNTDRMIQEATDRAKAEKSVGEAWTAKDQTKVYQNVYKEMVEKPEQYGSLKPGVPQWEAKSLMKDKGASMAVKTVDAKNRYRQRLIYNERPQAKDVMDIARERVEIDQSFNGLPVQDAARREFRNNYIRGLSDSEITRLNSEAETINRDMAKVQDAQGQFGRSLARQEAFDGQLSYLVAQRYERPEEATRRIQEAYRGGLSMPGKGKDATEGDRPSIKREVLIGQGADAQTYGQLKAKPTPPDAISVEELDTRISKAARLSVMQERVVQRSERNLLNVADNITEVTKAVTRVDVQINEALNRTERGGQAVRETATSQQVSSSQEVGRTPVKTEVDPDIETERVARGTVSVKDVSPTVIKSAKVSRADLLKGGATAMAPTALSVMVDKRVQKRVGSLVESAGKQTLREGYDGDDFDNNKLGDRMRRGLQDGAKRAMGANDPTQGRTGAKAPTGPQPGTSPRNTSGQRAGVGEASGAQTAAGGATSGSGGGAGSRAAEKASKRAAALNAAGGKTAGQGAATAGGARAAAGKAGATKAAATKATVKKAGAGKAAALGGSGVVAAAAAYKAREMAVRSMGLEPWR